MIFDKVNHVASMATQQSKLEACLEYVSVGCNRTPHCLDWNTNRLVAYGADKSVALARETRDGGGPDEVVAMLHGHSNRVNCVRWITPRSGHAQYTLEHRVAVEIASGSVDNTVIVWRRGDNGIFAHEQTLAGHTGAVTCLASVNLLSEGSDPVISTLIASGSADSAVCIWERSEPTAQFSLLQTLSFGRGFVMGVDFHELPQVKGQPLLACGGDDAKIHLFTKRQDGQFSRVMSLSGHEDWIRDINIAQEDGGDLLLASCSQDAYIRLWRIAMETEETTPCSDELKVTSNVFSISQGTKFKVTIESVLIGHEDWVYSVQFQPLQLEPTMTQPLSLLSVSMDKSMLVWQPDPVTGVWSEHVRVGNVGGNTLGLYGGRFSPRGDMIIGHGYQGAFHLWKRIDRLHSDGVQIEQLGSSNDTTLTNKDDPSEKWIPLPTMGGHFNTVQDISWDTSGEFLISVSSDQTSRLHAPWRGIPSEREVEKINKMKWREIARPQIHGYDMQCVTMVNSLLYVSGADEKVLRVFRAPKNFVGNLKRISEVNLEEITTDLPVGASVPSLGLSNKAVFTGQNSAKPATQQSSTGGVKNAFGEDIPVFTAVDLQEPPVEVHLLQNTLWPETQKLYGHGYELYCVASSPDGEYVASACKASKLEHASIRVWSTSTWRQVTSLVHHTLTVTQLAFSHSGHQLLAVSRDRCWSLWQLNKKDGGLDISLEACTNKSVKSHSRIIWSCSWSSDDSCFATGSRDKKVCVWSCDDCEGMCGWRLRAPPLECSTAVTAVDFAPIKTSDSRHILAVGFEDGSITLHTCLTPSHTLSPSNFWSTLLTLSPSHCHTSTVKRLQWRPMRRENDTRGECRATEQTDTVTMVIPPTDLWLASCSTDHCVKIFRNICG